MLALAILLFGLPFYFGYGNPLPFAKQEYSLLDNVWLCIFPLMFSGLALGWRYPRLGGYLVVLPVAIGLLLGIILARGMVFQMLVPLVPGALFIAAGLQEKKAG